MIVDDPIWITGIGPLWPGGADAESLRAAALSLPDEPRIRIDDALLREAQKGLDPGRLRRVDRLSLVSLLAARAALRDAGLEGVSDPDGRFGVVFGTAYGAVDDTRAFVDRLLERGPRLANPAAFPNLVFNAPAGHISLLFGLRGPNLTVSQREVTAEHALVLASDLLAAGAAEWVLAGGGDIGSEIVDAALGRLRVAGRAGEGACFLVLEKATHARARGARARARLTGSGVRTAPSRRLGFPDGPDALIAAARRALSGTTTVDRVVVGGALPGPLQRLEQAALSSLFPTRTEHLAIGRLTGELASGGAFKVAVGALLGGVTLVLTQATGGQAMALVIEGS